MSAPEGPARIPPRFVPTLTEVVPAAFIGAASHPVQQPVPAPEPLHAAPPPAPSAAALEELEDQLLHRVLQRVDLSLDRRLRDAIAAVVLQHTQALLPRLHEEIEFVVRQAVSEAVAAELAQRQGG